MIIHQILPNLSYGDAIGDDTLALRSIFRSLGYESRIFAGVIHRKLHDEANDWSHYRYVSDPSNILVYHFSVGSEITDYIMSIPDRVIIVFHNITPAHWFFGNSPHMTEVASEGMAELRTLKTRAMTSWADSEYNASILRELGYKNVHVLPIIVELNRLNRTPDAVFSRQWNSTQFTWSFIGRLSPNKCHQDIIRAFAFFKRYLHPHSRLIFIGENRNCWRYTQAMQKLVRTLRTGDVHFTGMIDDSELVAAYMASDVFVCMSEHEGFCVPLLEAMHFDVPVIAYDAGAIRETLGGAGLLLRSKHPAEIAELVDVIRTNPLFREAIIRGQRDRLNQFHSLDLTGRVQELLAGIDS
ncbi:glycosyltransferase [bacterium]|nr:glycosyltransferase [candidate division CSSED10-310 bacterium]